MRDIESGVGSTPLSVFSATSKVVRVIREQPLPLKRDWNNSSSVLSNLQESRLCQIKVLEERVAPPTIVIRLGRVRWTEVCSSHNDGPREAQLWVTIAFDLIACPTAQAIVEQSSA
ncbi:hypothetical protein CsSME_00035087 [Camellia sinensis var. sinensis]